MLLKHYHRRISIMEKKPIIPFLKVMSIIVLIQSVIGILINGFAAFLAPVVETSESGIITPITWISLAVSIVCLVINFILAIMALQHKEIELVYKVSIVTLIVPAVFSVVIAGGVSDYISIAAGAVISALFCYAAFKQNKLDQAK